MRAFRLALTTGAALGVFGSACSLLTSLDGLSGVVDADAQAGDAAQDGPRDAADDVTHDSSAPLLRSCQDLTGTTPAAPDGYYMIDPDGSGSLAPLEVYCNMSTAGGGWTLIGRSVAGPSAAFGWTAPTGAVRDDQAPYSLGVALSIPFTEVLIGQRDKAKQLVNAAFILPVGSDFRTANANLAKAVTPAVALGTCAPTGGPSMLHFIGHTNQTAAFFLRDTPDPADPAGGTYGLHPNGFALLTTGCSVSADMDGQQGELFVR